MRRFCPSRFLLSYLLPQALDSEPLLFSTWSLLARPALPLVHSSQPLYPRRGRTPRGCFIVLPAHVVIHHTESCTCHHSSFVSLRPYRVVTGKGNNLMIRLVKTHVCIFICSPEGHLSAIRPILPWFWLGFWSTHSLQTHDNWFYPDPTAFAQYSTRASIKVTIMKGPSQAALSPSCSFANGEDF